MNIENFIKKAYTELKDTEPLARAGPCLSEEDVACWTEGRLGERERKKFLNHAITCRECADNLKVHLRASFDDSGKFLDDIPEALVFRAKDLVKSTLSQNILDVIVEFGQKTCRVLKSTGSIVAQTLDTQAVPAFALRASDVDVGEKLVVLSKDLEDFTVDLTIEMIEQQTAHLGVLIKDKITKAPLSGQRVSLVYQDRELESFITDGGRVRFENVKFRDYTIKLIRDGKSICVALISLRTKSQ